MAFLAAALLGVPAGVAAQEAPLQRNDFSLRPGDMLRINVWPDDSLSGEFVVEETGLVYLPFLGSIRATGVSITDLRQRLRQGYAELMREPVVTITPVFRVSVLGAVRNPGNYPVTPANSLFEVIGSAGGFVGNANAEAVRIVRPNEVIRVDIQRALEEGANLAAMELRPGDRVLVPARGSFSVRTAFEIVRTLSVGVLLIERLAN